MARSFCVLLTRGPYGAIHAAEALRHGNGGMASGLPTLAILTDDGVYAAVAGQEEQKGGWTSISQTLAQTLKFSITLPDGGINQARVLAHGPSLEERGLTYQDLVPGVEVSSDEEVARLLAEAVLIY